MEYVQRFPNTFVHLDTLEGSFLLLRQRRRTPKTLYGSFGKLLSLHYSSDGAYVKNPI